MTQAFPALKFNLLAISKQKKHKQNTDIENLNNFLKTWTELLNQQTKTLRVNIISRRDNPVLFFGQEL
jgi:hypothetical protein